MTAPGEVWTNALRALAALATDPDGLKGMTVRARSGPVRAAFEDLLRRLPGPVRRIHTGLTDVQLFGGLDIAASLSKGRAVRNGGLSDTPALLVMPMAERISPGLAARLSMLLDSDRGHRLILLDEGAEQDERAPACLRERLAFHIDLDALHHSDTRGGLPAPADLDGARSTFTRVATAPGDAAQLTALAARFGIGSMRAPHFALHAARALAALDGRLQTAEEDLRGAAELIYPSRATMLPEPPAGEHEQPPEQRPESGDADLPGDDAVSIPDEMLIAAVRACLPPDALDRLAQGLRGTSQASSSGSGARRKGNRRGRPVPSRSGRPDGRRRIDVIATLRAAAPWQTIRRKEGAHSGNLLIRPGDIHLRRYEDRSDRLLLFVVDASGSAALARLAEAKGAVELLLAQAYSRRDQVALIAFRDRSADLLLAPTRSLVQAKRRLSGLPGGGGTPLAAGLEEALSVALRARSQGLSPALVLLTDGKANVALDGSGGRTEASEDADRLARLIASHNVPGLVIDISPRQAGETAKLARMLAARQIPLPRADAAEISRAVNVAFTA